MLSQDAQGASAGGKSGFARWLGAGVATQGSYYGLGEEPLNSQVRLDNSPQLISGMRLT